MMRTSQSKGIIAILSLILLANSCPAATSSMVIDRGDKQAEDRVIATLEEKIGVEIGDVATSKDAITTLGVNSSNRPGTGKISYDLFRSRMLENFDVQGSQFLNFEIEASTFPVRNLYGKGLSMRSGFFDNDGRHIPAIVLYKKSNSIVDASGDLEIYVRIPGGPGDVQVFSGTHSLVEYYPNTVFIDLYYTGNGFNMFYPEPSFGLASDQVASLLSELRRLNPTAKIVLIGESFGAVVSLAGLELAQKSKEPESALVDKLVLISPPFGSLNETGQVLEGMFSGDRDGRFLDYRLRSNDKQYNDFGTIQKLDWLDVYRGFYEAAEGEKRLFERFRDLPNVPPSLVVYGTEDRRIMVDRSTDFFQHPIEDVSLLAIEGMAHSIDPLKDRKRIIDRIAEFVED